MSGIYRGWLGQDRPCYNTNTQPTFSNIRPSFQFSLKPSKARPSVSKARPSVSKACLSVLKVWPYVFKEMLGGVFDLTNTLRIFDNLVCKKQPPYIQLEPWTCNKASDIYFQFWNFPFNLNLFLFSLHFFSFSNIDY